MTITSMARLGLGAAVLAAAGNLVLTTTSASAAVVQITIANVSKGYDIGMTDGAFGIIARVDNSDPVTMSDNGTPMVGSPMTPTAAYCSVAGELCVSGLSDASKGIHHVVLTQDGKQFAATYFIPGVLPGSGMYPTPIALPSGSSGS
ncbi:hypothetical protein [Nocardia sp. NBC_00511]|uniref:hypothetical protein n=1 Tax=Nocardia sp. NBC_00511 TaxID=2903591 RepID=UPI0030DDF757